MIYLLMYLTYICLGYKAMRWCIDSEQQSMELGLFLICILFAWPFLLWAAVQEHIEFPSIKPRG